MVTYCIFIIIFSAGLRCPIRCPWRGYPSRPPSMGDTTLIFTTREHFNIGFSLLSFGFVDPVPTTWIPKPEIFNDGVQFSNFFFKLKRKSKISIPLTSVFQDLSDFFLLKKSFHTSQIFRTFLRFKTIAVVRILTFAPKVCDGQVWPIFCYLEGRLEETSVRNELTCCWQRFMYILRFGTLFS